MEDKKNSIKVCTSCSGAELNISAPSIKQVISATNNKAQYYAEQAMKYRDEAKAHRDNAKYYSEQNSDVTFEYINNIKASLEDEISQKQNVGNYALKEELPVNVSELENDSNYVTNSQLASFVEELKLPEQQENSGRFLMTNGEEVCWASVNSFSLFDTKLSDRILAGEEALGWALQGTYVSRAIYPDFYAKCLEQKETAIATETTLNGSTITLYNHSNGHKFYDISDKATIDSFYSAMGTAWFYGIDSENERIFLPRNAFFEQVSENSLEVGNSVKAGLPNITGTFYPLASNTSSVANSSGALYQDAANTGSGSATGQSYWRRIALNASRSNSIYGNSNTVQPNAVKKLLYICVGNTTVNEALVDVGQLSSDLQYKADKTEVDGQWVNKPIALSSATALNTYTLDLSNYLPNDGYNYEVLFVGSINNTGTSVCGVSIGTDIASLMTICRVKGTGSGTYAGDWNVILPVGPKRTVTYRLEAAVAAGANFHAKLYRRLGTNL